MDKAPAGISIPAPRRRLPEYPRLLFVDAGLAPVGKEQHRMAATITTLGQRTRPLLALARRGLHPALWLNFGGPIAAYQVLTQRGVSATDALLVGAAFPLTTLLAKALRSRRLDLIGSMSLAALAVGVLATLLFQDPHILLVKDSLVTATFGLVCLGSLFTSRPLMGILAAQFAGSAGRSTVPANAPGLRRLTLVWGITMLAEAALRVVLAFLLPPALLMTISPLLAAAVFGPVALWTLRRRAAAIRRQAVVA